MTLLQIYNIADQSRNFVTLFIKSLKQNFRFVQRYSQCIVLQFMTETDAKEALQQLLECNYKLKAQILPEKTKPMRTLQLQQVYLENQLMNEQGIKKLVATNNRRSKFDDQDKYLQQINNQRSGSNLNSLYQNKKQLQQHLTQQMKQYNTDASVANKLRDTANKVDNFQLQVVNVPRQDRMTISQIERKNYTQQLNEQQIEEDVEPQQTSEEVAIDAKTKSLANKCQQYFDEVDISSQKLEDQIVQKYAEDSLMFINTIRQFTRKDGIGAK